MSRIPRAAVVVLYGSETGCAQDAAEAVCRELKRRYIKSVINLPMDEYDIRLLPTERIVVFVLSTTGQGEMPSNMLKFWRFLLRKNLPTDSLANTKFAMCGLGDSGYQSFNFAAKKLYKRVIQLSGRFILEPAYTDDQHPLGVHQIFNPWLESLCNVLQNIFPLPSGITEILPKQKPESKYIVQTRTSTSNDRGNDKDSSIITTKALEAPFTQANPYHATLLSNQRLTEKSWQQDVREYNFEIHPSMSFEPGDALAILPCNPTDIVLQFLHRLHIDPELIIERITLRDATCLDCGPKSFHHVPTPISVFDLCKNYLDILGTPRVYFFELLAYFASAEHEIERLKYFSDTQSVDGQQEMRIYNEKERRTVVEVLDDFPSTLPPLEYLFDLIPPIQPRLFSIASSFKLLPNQAQLLVAKVDFVTPFKRLRSGLCTSWLASLQPGSDNLSLIRTWIHKSAPEFHLPVNLEAPLLMIGPGTGLAPFRAFIQERYYHFLQKATLGYSALYTGCRHRDKDYYYEMEMSEYVSNHVLSHYFVAFSRDYPTESRNKIYVQHLLRENSSSVWNVIKMQDTYFCQGQQSPCPRKLETALKISFSKKAT